MADLLATSATDARLRVVDGRAHEVRMATLAGKLAAPLTLLLAAPAFALRGAEGLSTALLASVLVVGGFVATGFAHGWAASRGPATLQTVALGGLLLRLWFYGVLLVVLGPVAWLDAPTLAVTLPTAVVVLLAAEVRFVSTHPELWFVEVAPERADPTAPSGRFEREARA